MINRKLRPGNAIIEHRGERCRQVFSVNYGLIDYVERRQHDAVPALFTLRF
jgi:hypothetical protein